MKGFVFIDITVTVAIISILAAVAIPAYNDYITKSKAAEISLLLITVKKAVTDYYAYHGKLPTDNKAAGISAQIKGNYVSAINVKNGVIQVNLRQGLDKQLAGAKLNLQPVLGGNPLIGIMDWTCSSTLADKYLPKYCRSS